MFISSYNLADVRVHYWLKSRALRAMFISIQLHRYVSPLRRERDAFHQKHTRHFVFRRSEEHTSELQSRENLVCRLLLEKKNNNTSNFKFVHMFWLLKIMSW